MVRRLAVLVDVFVVVTVVRGVPMPVVQVIQVIMRHARVTAARAVVMVVVTRPVVPMRSRSLDCRSAHVVPSDPLEPAVITRSRAGTAGRGARCGASAQRDPPAGNVREPRRRGTRR